MAEISEIQTLVLTTEDLARHLGTTPGVIRNRLYVDPDSLPPRVRLPGLRGSRWLTETVIKWLRDRVDEQDGRKKFSVGSSSSTDVAAVKRGRGRPPKIPRPAGRKGGV